MTMPTKSSVCVDILKAIQDEKGARQYYTDLILKINNVLPTEQARELKAKIDEIRGDEIDHRKKLGEIVIKYCGCSVSENGDITCEASGLAEAEPERPIGCAERTMKRERIHGPNP